MDFWKELSKPANTNAFMLSFWASMGTFLGGLLVLLLVGLLGADPGSRGTAKVMGILQAVSAGVMIFMTCFHLLPESTESVGSRQSMIYFFLGVIAFGVLEEFIIPHEAEQKEVKKGKKSTGVRDINQKDQMELYRTSLITFIAMALHNIPEGISVYLASLSNQKMVRLVHVGLSIGYCYHAP
jgi:ZIP family zinc transporter